MNILDEKIVYDGYFKIKELSINNPKTEQTYTRELFERGHCVAALVHDSDANTFLFTKQFRVGSRESMLEIPAGVMDKEGEEPIQTLQRELHEELGVKISPHEDDAKNPHCHYLGKFYTSPGGSSESIHLFVVTKIERTGEGGGLEEENEDIEVVELSPDDLMSLMKANKISDMKTLFALYAYFADIQARQTF